MTDKCKLISYNCKSVKRSAECVRSLCKSADIVALQEHWLLPHDLPFLGTIDKDFGYTGTSAVDTSAGILRGRPYGGVGILWRKDAFQSVSVVECSSVRLTAIRATVSNSDVIFVSAYLPTDSYDVKTERCRVFVNITIIVLLIFN